MNGLVERWSFSVSVLSTHSVGKRVDEDFSFFFTYHRILKAAMKHFKYMIKFVHCA